MGTRFCGECGTKLN
ncbi:hypothetical protein [Methanosarcina barkeri]|nr:hypothetical protein [Methanosarcina barkeri]